MPSVLLRNGAVRWKQAYARFFQGLARHPTIQRKTGAQAVWVTSELFRFADSVNAATGQVTPRLLLGTKKFPVGAIAFTAHRAFTPPASLHITIDNGRWFLFGSFDDAQAAPAPEDIGAQLARWDSAALLTATVGVDRGVAVPACASTGQAFDFSETQKRRMAHKEAAAQRWQRALSRRRKGGANRRLAAYRYRAVRQYEKNVRQDFAHQTSHTLVSNPITRMIVFEDLGVQRMTRRAKPKRDETGHYVRNGVAAKSGLNVAILRSAWGRLRGYTEYKARRAGTLFVSVPAQYSSQECAACGHIHPDNRISQSVFVCQRCGHHDNADANAAQDREAQSTHHQRRAGTVRTGGLTANACGDQGQTRSRKRPRAPINEAGNSRLNARALGGERVHQRILGKLLRGLLRLDFLFNAHSHTSVGNAM